jgi:sec-independent protein translocase protein TatB
MNFGFSGEMIFLFFLALILFGPKKLPEIGRTIGRFMNEFRRASNEFRSQIESEINAVQSDVKPQILPSLQAPLGSLASRIFNPPPPQQLEAAESKTASPEATHPPADSATEIAPAPTPAPKAAPDA